MGSSTGRTPRTVEALWQWMVAELDKLGRRRYLDTGSWVVEENDAGALIATHASTGAQVVIAAPPTG